MQKIRICLQKNKIFFETIAAVLVSGAAVFVSWSQLQVYRAQTTIQEQTVLPHFVITARQIASLQEPVTYDDDVITIRNVGAPISQFSVRNAVLFHITVDDQTLNKWRITRDIFINGYYISTAHTAEATGLLATIRGIRNNKMQAALEHNFREVSRTYGKFGLIEIKRFIQISYIDLLGRGHTEYYFVPMIYGAARLTDQEGKEVFDAWERSLSAEILEFAKIDADALLLATGVKGRPTSIWPSVVKKKLLP